MLAFSIFWLFSLFLLFFLYLQGFIPGGALKPVDGGLETNFDVTEHYWFPMLAGLSDLTLDSRLEVRNCALEVLFDLLNERGRKFSSAFWEGIFHRVLFPIFDHVRNAGRDGLVSSGDEWLRETSIHSLQLLCNLFNTFYKVSIFDFLHWAMWTISCISACVFHLINFINYPYAPYSFELQFQFTIFFVKGSYYVLLIMYLCALLFWLSSGSIFHASTTPEFSTWLCQENGPKCGFHLSWSVSTSYRSWGSSVQW